MVLSVVEIVTRFNPLVPGDQVCVLARKSTHLHFTWAIGVVAKKGRDFEARAKFRAVTGKVINVDLTSDEYDVEEILYQEELHTFQEYFSKAENWTTIGATTHEVLSEMRFERVRVEGGVRVEGHTIQQALQDYIESTLDRRSQIAIIPVMRSVVVGLFPSHPLATLNYPDAEDSVRQLYLLIGLFISSKRGVRSMHHFLIEEDAQKGENPWHSPLNLASGNLANENSSSNSIRSSKSRYRNTLPTTDSGSLPSFDWSIWSKNLAPIFRLTKINRGLLNMTDLDQLKSALMRDDLKLNPMKRSFILIWHYLRDRITTQEKNSMRRRERQRAKQRSVRRFHRQNRSVLYAPVSLKDLDRLPCHLISKPQTASLVSSWLGSAALSRKPMAPRPLTCTTPGKSKGEDRQRSVPATTWVDKKQISSATLLQSLGGHLWEGPLSVDGVLPHHQLLGASLKFSRTPSSATTYATGISSQVPVPVSEVSRDFPSGPQPSLCVRALTWQVVPMIKSIYFTKLSSTSILEVKLISIWQVGTRFSAASRERSGMSTVSNTMLHLFGIDLPAAPDPRTSDYQLSESPEPSPLDSVPLASSEKDKPVSGASTDSQSFSTSTVSTSMETHLHVLRLQRLGYDTSTPVVCRTTAEYVQNELLKAEKFSRSRPRDRNRIPITNPAFPWHRKQRMSYEGEPDIAIHNGYDPGGGFHVDGVHPVTKRNNDLEMYKTTDNILDLKTLSEDSPLLRETLLPLLDTKIFEETMFLPQQSEIKGKRRLSRGMLKHLPTLLECDHAELAPAEVEILDYLGCFLVEKKDGSGRFICNCRPMNARQVLPGPMGLPSIQAVISQILTWTYASQCDGKSFFCQFELAEGIRKHFACRLADMRGKIVTILLKRMPMGWSHAPRIAQAVANHIMEDIGVGWVDNFILGAETEEKFNEKRELLRSRLKRYNLEVDDLTMEMTQSLFCLGLEFDLKEHRYRLDPKWIEKRASVFKYAASLQEISFRKFFELVGSLIWASYVTDEPLWMHAETLAALSQLAKVVQDRWDDKCEVPEYAYRDIQSWVRQVTQNCWCGSPHSRDCGSAEESAGGVRKPRVFSDASDFGAAWVRIVEKSIVAGQQWHRDPSVDGNIFMGELDALLQAFQANDEDEGYAVDNLGLRLAVKKGHSSSYEANVKLREVFGRRWPKVWWISTDVNIADPFSRGVIIPPFSEPARLENWVVYDDGSGDNLSESSKILSDFPNFPEWKKLKPF